jgi:hypothetical protein
VASSPQPSRYAIDPSGRYIAVAGANPTGGGPVMALVSSASYAVTPFPLLDRTAVDPVDAMAFMPDGNLVLAAAGAGKNLVAAAYGVSGGTFESVPLDVQLDDCPAIGRIDVLGMWPRFIDQPEMLVLLGLDTASISMARLRFVGTSWTLTCDPPVTPPGDTMRAALAPTGDVLATYVNDAGSRRIELRDPDALDVVIATQAETDLPFDMQARYQPAAPSGNVIYFDTALADTTNRSAVSELGVRDTP